MTKIRCRHCFGRALGRRDAFSSAAVPTYGVDQQGITAYQDTTAPFLAFLHAETSLSRVASKGTATGANRGVYTAYLCSAGK
jgi:hypothetical protein